MWVACWKGDDHPIFADTTSGVEKLLCVRGRMNLVFDDVLADNDYLAGKRRRRSRWIAWA
jgi:hypothetical protein